MTRVILPGLTCPGCGRAELEAREPEPFGGVGTLVCANRRCAAPDAAQRILAEASPFHTAQVGAHDFAVEHPLMERLDGTLLDGCPFGDWMSSLTGAPVTPGRYRVIPQPLEYKGLPWRFERIPPVDDDGRVPHDPDAATKAGDTEGVSA
jgi:hypothetical protein